MIQTIPMPRLLPLTILVLAALLGLKSVQLGRAVLGLGGSDRPAAGVVAAAEAAAATQPAPQAQTTPQPQSAHASPATGPAAGAMPSVDPPAEAKPISDSERAVLLELRQRRQELDARESAMVARESVLVAAEQKLAARVAELQALQKQLEALDAARKQREDASWQGLVKLYEAMRPRDAAVIFNDLDMPVLLQVVDRMKEAKAAPIFAAMVPDKAREITARLAQLRTRRDNPGTDASGG